MSLKRDKLIVGIDLGTTYSGVAVWDNERGGVRMLEDADGYSLTPSILGWDRYPKRNWVIGREARVLGEEHPGEVVYSIKRYIGHWFTDPEVFYGQQNLTYKLLSGGGRDQLHDVVVDFGADDGKPIQLTAPQVSAKVLLKLRQDAANALGVPLEEIRSAVITVPAYFNVRQRKATIAAGEEAGLDEIYILNEPTAAALAYSDVVLDSSERRILVYDLGGGTFDISLLEVTRDEGGYIFETIVIDGNTQLGGDDIDVSVAQWLADEIEKRYGYQVLQEDLITRERLRRAAEQAKTDLSNPNLESVVVDLSALSLGSRSPFDVHLELTRTQLEVCAASVIERTKLITQRAVEKVAGLKWSEIDEVILVGGQTLMPAVQREVELLTGHKPRINDKPQLAVALGAAEYAHIIGLDQEQLQEKTLINVIALPLGILLEDNTFEVLVPANKTVPYMSKPFPVTPKEENQSMIYVKVLQGSRDTKRADECLELGAIPMEVPLASRPKPKFEIVFDVQSDGTLRVLVTDPWLRRQKVLDIAETRRILVGRNLSSEKVEGTSSPDQSKIHTDH